MEHYRSQLMLRWSLLTGGLIALFWLIYYFINGSVPIISTLKWSNGQTIFLPFSISRWFDILIGPIYSIIFVFLLTSDKFNSNDDLSISLVFGLVIGLIFALGVGLFVGLIAGPGVGLGFGLVFFLAFGLLFGLGVVMGVGLGFGLIFGLGFGLIAGLSFVLGFGLFVGLVAGLVVAVKTLFPSLIRRLWRWLMVR